MIDRDNNSPSADLDRRVAQTPTDIAPPRDFWPSIAAAIRAETLPKDQRPPADLWPGIRARLAAEAAARPGRATARPIGWVVASGGLAAALVLGIIIGRQSADPGIDAAGTPVVAEAEITGHVLPAAYRRAVGEHLREAETVLVLFNSSVEPDAGLVGLARELAATSRLLSGSRAGEDPEVRAMLLELELLLMQVARVVDDDPTERQVVREGTADEAVLARLRLMIAEETERTGI
jgi:hypothetical protein